MLAIYHDLYLRILVQLLSLTDFAFCSFTFWILHRLSELSTASYFCSQHNLSKSSTIFCFAEMLLAFKMGVKIFWTATILLLGLSQLVTVLAYP
jgi:hypothetical protein